MLRDWWKRHFGGAFAAPTTTKPDEVEHCSACGQPFMVRDLNQVLPHFEHQLALATRPMEDPLPDEGLDRKVVPFRRPGTSSPLRADAS